MIFLASSVAVRYPASRSRAAYKARDNGRQNRWLHLVAMLSVTAVFNGVPILISSCPGGFAAAQLHQPAIVLVALRACRLGLMLMMLKTGA